MGSDQNSKVILAVYDCCVSVPHVRAVTEERTRGIAYHVFARDRAPCKTCNNDYLLFSFVVGLWRVDYPQCRCLFFTHDRRFTSRVKDHEAFGRVRIRYLHQGQSDDTNRIRAEMMAAIIEQEHIVLTNGSFKF